MRLSKLHGLGNDFLVLLDDGSAGPVPPERVRQLCQRRTGVGADGLIRSERVASGAVTFELVNADGSPAEMSGNGARCLGLAAARAGWWDDRTSPLVVHTAVGERPLDWQGGDVDQAWLRGAMGEVRPAGDDAEPGWDSLVKHLRANGDGRAWSFWRVDVGNPHTVSLINGPMPPREHLVDALTVDDASLGRSNYEFVVRGPQVGEVTLVVHERGAGWTQACGTGSVAAAWAAHQQGWVGRLVTVHNPGGAVQVDLTQAEARLTGPAGFIADLEVPDAGTRSGARP